MSIAINLDKAKAIAHNIRRVARAEEFKPLDVKATIPAEAAEAEVARQAIRDKYAQIQADIDAATTVDKLETVMAKWCPPRPKGWGFLLRDGN